MTAVRSLEDSGKFTGHEIQNAINSLPDGGEILLGAGTYIVDEPIYLTSAIKLRGQGRSQTIIELAPGASCHVFTNKNHMTGNNDISVFDLTIEGNMEHQVRPKDVMGLTFSCALYFKNCCNINIRDVRTKNIRQTGCHFSRCTDVTVLGFEAYRVGWSGISTSGTDNIYTLSKVVDSGLDILHSALHFDGGKNVTSLLC